MATPAAAAAAPAPQLEGDIKLVSEDAHEFVTPKNVAAQCKMIKTMLEVSEEQEFINLPNVKGKELEKVIEYCRYHVQADKPDSGVSDNDKKTWDENFVKVDKETLFNLIMAANYLDVKSLLDLTCATVANMLKNKTPEEIRREFNIKNDLTPEEEEEIKRESAWLYQ
ncbi:putative WSKP1 protein [Paratrimastix pyriformis]|uniref:WSKP1 protein n=1 Tax=Paratrimastix pyriformis TaxID=342808 RepID=A0ABQ8UGE2_9EUKA|nr:putative WSKP1 protein [Paratrimastix pyriformis]|eukprot:GAFH01004329.1.p1 GENE.GAFH01004329.1~~GAFH01004329.1.p1  ORF type:complete len:183 (-),score=65.65 GAFH01004329.1:253-756(-)